VAVIRTSNCNELFADLAHRPKHSKIAGVLETVSAFLKNMHGRGLGDALSSCHARGAATIRHAALPQRSAKIAL
jgi:hypothetical protein